jgi:hypothetical protein
MASFPKEVAISETVFSANALQIDAKAVKFRREKSLIVWLVWLDFLSVYSKVSRQFKKRTFSNQNAAAAPPQNQCRHQLEL